MSWLILTDDIALLILNIVATGLLLSLCGLIFGKTLKNSPISLQHAVMLATLLLLLGFPWLTLALSHHGMGWFRLLPPRDSSTVAASQAVRKDAAKSAPQDQEPVTREIARATNRSLPKPSSPSVTRHPKDEATLDRISSDRSQSPLPSRPRLSHSEPRAAEPAQPPPVAFEHSQLPHPVSNTSHPQPEPTGDSPQRPMAGFSLRSQSRSKRRTVRVGFRSGPIFRRAFLRSCWETRLVWLRTG